MLYPAELRAREPSGITGPIHRATRGFPARRFSRLVAASKAMEEVARRPGVPRAVLVRVPQHEGRNQPYGYCEAHDAIGHQIR